MKRLLFSILLALSGFLPTAEAHATVYAWVLTGADRGSGTLVTADADRGGADIVSFTGFIDGSMIEGLQGGHPGDPASSPTGAFIYDNILFPDRDRVLDGNGILFRIAGTEANLWDNGAGYGYANAVCGNCLTLQNNAAIFTIVPTPDGTPALSTDASDLPEPMTLTVFGIGLAGLAATRRATRDTVIVRLGMTGRVCTSIWHWRAGTRLTAGSGSLENTT